MTSVIPMPLAPPALRLRLILTLGLSEEPAGPGFPADVKLEETGVGVVHATLETGRDMLGPIEVTSNPRAIAGTVAADSRIEVCVLIGVNRATAERPSGQVSLT